MNKQVQISVIVPCYNCQKTIERCINSIASNICSFDYEIICIDNNSTDNTLSILKKYNNIVLATQKKQGRSFTRNLGISLAKGTYIAFVDSDVIIEENWLQIMYKALVKDNSHGAQSQVIQIPLQKDSLLDKFRYYRGHSSTMGTFSITNIIVKEFPMINSAACIYSKESLVVTKGFDEKLKRHEDIDLSKRTYNYGYPISMVLEAKAFVMPNTETIIQYLYREFDHGFTKASYNKKWEIYKKRPSFSHKNKFITNFSQKESHKENHTKSSLAYIYFLLLNSLCVIIRTFGIITGLLFKKEYTLLKQGSLNSNAKVFYKNTEIKLNKSHF